MNTMINDGAERAPATMRITECQRALRIALGHLRDEPQADGVPSSA